LSLWRTHGYRQWHAFHVTVDETCTLSDNAEVIVETGIDCEKLLLALTASYAEMIQRWIITPCDQMTYKLAVFKQLTNGVLALRQAEIQKVRLEIARERLELLREKRGNKSASSSNTPASSTESASRDASSSSTPARPEAPEPHRSAPPSPRPCDDHDHPRELCEPSASIMEGSAPSLPSTMEGSAPSLPMVELPRPADADAASQGAAPQQRSEPPIATPKPPAPQEAPLFPNRRPGGPPRNATPRNPLGLL
jgi:hypothetical protein